MTPDFTKAKLKIDQTGVSDCVGDYIVLDVFCSVKFNEIAYKVQTDDGSELIYTEEELLGAPQSP